MSTPLPVLVFDLDGTLIESAPEIRHCLNLLLAEYGRPGATLPQVERMIGNGVAKLVERGFEATGGMPGDFDAALTRFIAIYNDAPIAETPVYDGVPETLARLHEAGHVMAICTNKLYEPTVKILEGLGFARYFRAVAGGDSFSVRKPDPGHLLGVLERLGAAREDAIMIGDSPNDIGCAIDAGVRSIALSYGYSNVPAAELGADRLVDRFADLPEAIASLSRQ
ncbi:MAG: HAD family hydrolase [Alphaproteobacteria bacterium]